MSHAWKSRNGMLAGGLVGLLLSVGSIAYESALLGLTSLSAIARFQSTRPLLWICDLLPILFGVAGQVIDSAITKNATRSTAELQQDIARLSASHRALEDESHELRTGADDLEETNRLMSCAVRRFEELFQGLPVACFSYDSDGRIIEWNRASEAFFQKSAKDVTQKLVWQTIAGSESGILSPDNLARVMAGETLAGQEWDFHAPDGVDRHVIGSAFPLRGADQEITGGICANIDITDRKHAEENQKRLNDILESTPDFVATASPDGRIRYLNAAARRTLGLRADARVDTLTLPDLHPVEIAERVLTEALNVATSKGIWSGESQILGIRGRPIPHSQVMIAHKDSAGEIQFYSTIARDISLRKHYEDEILQYSQMLEAANASLEELATQDGLTTLFNHRAFQERLKTEWDVARRYGHGLSVVLLDVDHFKLYNDAHGHPAGDRILKQVGSILREHARTVDMAARYGGEEFAMILPSTDRQGALVLAERLRAAIEGACWEHRAVTASFGVATMTSAMGDRSELIAEADAALYKSKRRGRNRVTAASTHHTIASHRHPSTKAA